MSRPYVATVNGYKIYIDEFQLRINQKKALLPKDSLVNQPGYLKRFEEEVLDSMITEKIMYSRAQELQISVSSDELEEKIRGIKKEYGDDFNKFIAKENLQYEQWKEDVRREMLIKKLIDVDVNAHINVSEDEAEDYFEEHRNLYKTDPRVRVYQIVVRDLATAQNIAKRLNEGADFAQVATQSSIGPEARYGGDLGFITRQVMPEPLDGTIFNLPLNVVSPVVQSSYGFHILKVVAKEPAKIKSLSDAKEEVIAAIKAKKEEAAFVNWLEGLRIKAVVKKETAVLRKNNY
jgi:parvulin-like peptidyl-prolyl isomerase